MASQESELLMSTIALTPGCPAGIGPEIYPKAILRALKSDWFAGEFLWCASPALFIRHAQGSNIKVERQGQRVFVAGFSMDCILCDEEDEGVHVSPGEVTDAAIRAQRNYLLQAIDLAKKRR